MNEQAMAKRREGIKWAGLLEKALNNNLRGDEYKVNYDVCESGFTCVYKNGECVHRVPNTEMVGSLNVYDYR